MSPATEQPVTLAVADHVAVVSLNNPPVNALQPTVLNSLFSVLRKAQSKPEVQAVVLTGAGGKFCAGFDFTLFGTPDMERVLEGRQEAVAALTALLENGAKPTVAAIEGPALGGGCELAMACNSRVCATGSQLGLPEVRLGLLPGLGGTQRLPRLVGVEQALNLMLSGTPIPAEDALAIGLVDEVVPPEDLLAAAKRAALQLAAAAGKGTRRRALQLTTHMPAGGEGLAAAVAALQDAEARVKRRMPGQQHFVLLLDAVAAGLAHGPPAGLQKEGEGFRTACGSRLHRMLLNMFKVNRSLKKAWGPFWLLAQAHLFLGLLLIYCYLRLLSIYTAFMVGYRNAREPRRKKQQQEAQAAAAAAAAASKEKGGPAAAGAGAATAAGGSKPRKRAK